MLRRSSTHTRRSRSRFGALASLVAAACVEAPVEWRGEPSFVQASQGAQRLLLGDDGRPRLELEKPVPPVGAIADSGMCERSVRTARGVGGERYAVWWRARANGSAALMSARSDDDGARWSAPVPVDTTDRGAHGCDRPAPAIAVDARTGYVHVAYHLRGAEGAGVFFSHSMERGALFHAPMAIVYGDRPAAASVASWGRMVVVAFENPNSAKPQLSLAISRTDGHDFERARVDASSANVAATDPMLAVRERRIVVGWRESGRIAIREGVVGAAGAP